MARALWAVHAHVRRYLAGQTRLQKDRREGEKNGSDRPGRVDDVSVAGREHARVGRQLPTGQTLAENDETARTEVRVSGRDTRHERSRAYPTAPRPAVQKKKRANYVCRRRDRVPYCM
jgi:hypothetical protein